MSGGEFISEPLYSEILARLDFATSKYLTLGATLRENFRNTEVRSRTTHDPATGISLLVLRIPPLDATHSLVVSDISHQLRSALDNLVFLLLDGHKLEDPKLQSGIQFPITSSPEKFHGPRSALLKAGAPDDLLDEIERMQPFPDAPLPRPFAPLALLHHINRYDKHRYLPAVVGRSKERIEPRDVEIVALDEYTSCDPFTVLNEGAESTEIPIYGIEARPRSARFEMRVTQPDMVPFGAVFGSEHRFGYEDLGEIVGAVDRTCQRLWAMFGSD